MYLLSGSSFAFGGISSSGCSTPFGSLDHLRDITDAGASAQKRSHQEIEAHRSIGGFQFRDTGLARAQALGQRRLREAVPLTQFSDACCQRELEVDKPALLSRQIQKLGRVANDPSRASQSIPCC